jgi:hypothetical protein
MLSSLYSNYGLRITKAVSLSRLHGDPVLAALEAGDVKTARGEAKGQVFAGRKVCHGGK